MQKIKNIMMAALTVLSAVLATGCISEKYDMPDNLQSVTVMLEVSADQMTKAPGGEEEPTAVEAKINSIRIFAYQGERLAGTFYRGQASDLPIFIDLALPEKGIHSVDFYVIANENAMNLTDNSPAITDRMSKSQLSQICFQTLNSTSENGLPMYGTTTAEIDVEDVRKNQDGSYVANPHPGHNGHIQLTQTVSVGLYRPIAKLSFMVAKKDEGDLVIEEVKMLAKGTRQYGYLLPTTETNLKAIGSRANDRVLSTDVEISKVLTESGDKTDPANYQDLTAGGIYMAEVPFGSTAWNEAVASDYNSVVLQLTFSAGEGTPLRTGYVYMPVINRNTHYKVLCSILPEGIITINYIIDDWTDAKMWGEDGNEGLIFDYPNHSYLYPDSATDAASADPATMSVGSPFVGYFKMTYPANETFNPTLMEGAAADYEVKVFDAKGTHLTDSDDFAASESWYKIEVHAKNAENAGHAVRLAITYHASWSDEAEYLMINGDGVITQNNTSYIWPYTGSAFAQNTDYVIITQQ